VAPPQATQKPLPLPATRFSSRCHRMKDIQVINALVTNISEFHVERFINATEDWPVLWDSRFADYARMLEQSVQGDEARLRWTVKRQAKWDRYVNLFSSFLYWMKAITVFIVMNLGNSSYWPPWEPEISQPSICLSVFQLNISHSTELCRDNNWMSFVLTVKIPHPSSHVVA
jgi:hypothetical protein